MRGVPRKYLALSVVGLLVGSLFVAYEFTSPQASTYTPVTQTGQELSYYSSLNHNNSLQFIHDVTTPCAQLLAEKHYNSSATNYEGVVCAKAVVRISHQEQDTANSLLLQRGFNASCLVGCLSQGGITYTEDPTAIMVNNGHDFMFNCKDFGTASVITCTSTDFATVMWLSTSATTPLVTDTGCGGGAGAGQITSGGLNIATGTFTAGTAGSGTVTSTLAHTWTAAETDTAVQNQCVMTENNAGGNKVLVYSFTFGPDTLVSGNTLTITDSLTAT